MFFCWVSTLDLLGVTIAELVHEHDHQPVICKKRGPVSKLEQQVKQIRQLPRSKQKFVSEMLDRVLQANG